MSDAPDHTRRWLINASGAAILSNAVPVTATYAQTAAAAPPNARPESHGDPSTISPVTTALADYVAKTLDRELPAAVVARTKLHLLDTIAAMVSGSRLKPGDFAARYVDSLGGKPQAMVIGTGIVTSAVNAALANAMAAHADETDDTNPVGPFHAGCGAVSAALASAELAGRTGSDVLRAVALGYDIGARLIVSLGVGAGAAATAQPVLPDDDVRRDRRRCCDAAPRSAPGAPRLVLCGAAGFRYRLLGTRPRAYREGVRFRRHGRAQRRVGGDNGRVRIHRGRGSLQRRPECVHRAGRQSGAR